MAELVDSPGADIPALYEQYREFDLVVDSRQVGRPDRTLFFALPGARRDGHAFIPGLIELGVRNFVVTSLPKLAYPDCRFNLLGKPIAVLQELAAYHRSQFPQLTVLAITGSNGKTTIKDWVGQLLATTFTVCTTPRSYNSQIGVPLSVWQLKATHDVAVFEVGVSKPGEMKHLVRIVQPTCGLLTNIGTAQLANFISPEQHLAEKLSLFEMVDWLLLPVDEVQAVQAARVSFPTVTLKLIQTEVTAFGSAQLRGQTIHQHNLSLAVAAAQSLGVESRVIETEVAHLRPLSNRLEQRDGRDGGPVINDSYSNDFSALAAALTFAETQDPYRSLTLILGTIQPLPNLPERLSALLGGRVHRLLLVGQPAPLVAHFPEAELFDSPQELLEALHKLDFSRQTVLVKGSSTQQLQRVADGLSRQLHRTILRVDLSALRHNFRAYREALPPGVRMIVMAKASAYGSGALPVARILQQVGADWLAVAYPEEGRTLRRGGITLPIMVLNAEAYSFSQLSEHQLEAVVHTEAQLRRANEQRLPVHLELDTGMSRLGFRAKDFRMLLRGTVLPRAHLRSIFTHLAASEDAVHDDFTRQQLALFDGLYAEYLETTRAPVPRHALNSNGISRFPTASYDLVRLGIGLYGIGDAAMDALLQPALSLTTTITSISQRGAEETVGYGRRGKLRGIRTIAVLSIGYADGLPRLAGEGRFSVKVGGQLAPTVGAICMDMCMIDVTEVAGARVQDEVTIFGPDHPIEYLAAAALTIPYEILTGVGERVHRVYSGE